MTAQRDVEVYSSVIAQELYPGMMEPLRWSIDSPLLNGAWARVLEEVSEIPLPEGTRLARRQFSHIYLNMGVIADALNRHGLDGDSIERLMGIGGQGEGGASLLDRLLAIARGSGLETRPDELMAREAARIERTEGMMAEGAGEEILVEEVDEFAGRLAELEYLNLLATLISRRVHRYHAIRDRTSALLTLGKDRIALHLDQLGARFVARGLLATAEDIRFLSMDEVRQIVSGGCAGNTCNNYRTRVLLRRREMAETSAAGIPSEIEVRAGERSEIESR